MEFQNLESEIYKDIEQEILLKAIEEDVEKELNKDETLNKSLKRKRKRYSSKILRSGIRIRTVLLLIMTLLVNTYAWFIYVSTVSMDISMHVKNWDFELSAGSTSENFEFNVEEIYPGMVEASKEINAKNNGETIADLSCEVTYLKVLGTEYVEGEEYVENGVTNVYTSDKLFEILNSYPFKVEIYIDGELYDGTVIPMSKNDVTTITFKINWEYERGETPEEIAEADALDTYWGNKAYDFAQTNPDDYSIEVKINVKAVQTSTDNHNP